ncbi:MAG: isoleucine--tRNA ligase [Nitrososphaerales archaeon]
MTAEQSSTSDQGILGRSYKPREIEDLVRQQWNSINLAKKIEGKFAGKKKQGYIDGPPTLNGEPHMGHLRGRIMKDLWYRFETLRGNNIDFRGGWDCQGLPVELAAEKDLGLSGNKTANLNVIGEEALVAACKGMLKKYHEIWKETDHTIGVLINDEKSYWTYHDSYIEREWQILRSAWGNGILSEGFRVTPFCPSCQTSLSAAEVALGGYQTLEDPSMYFKMKVVGAENTYLVVWTTMPFTVVTDELVGVKPGSEYCYVTVPGKEERSQETLIVGADRIDILMKELKMDSYVVEKSTTGKELEGLRYEHPLADIIPNQKKLEEQSKRVHTIVAEEFVDVTTGSGLVHMAPANGEDDFDVAQRRNVPVFNPIDDQAIFTSDAGQFAGLFVRDSDEKVADALKSRGLLLRYGKLKHEYPVCWRSGHRLVWLSRREYFYFVDRLKDRAVDAATKAEYYFEQPRNRFIEIVKEKRPWCVSRERVWGAPLPIWKCEGCGEKLGLFSRKEIVENSTSLPDGPNFELHRPWIDRILIHCKKCGRKTRREPFVLDTWHNSGAAPYASLSDEEYEQYVPVPFLTEGIDQTRGWAYTLLIENVMLTMNDQAPFQSFLFMGHVLDEKGEKLSKSKGNFVPVRDLLKQQSSDLTRLYLMWKASPIDSISFNLKEMGTRPFQILNTLYHMHLFYLQNASFDAFEFKAKSGTGKIDVSKNSFKKQDRWLLSKLESLLSACTVAYSESKYQEAARALEKFIIEDISQTYVPIIRSEMWEESEESKDRRKVVYSLLGLVLLNTDKLLHPIAPFVTDYLARESFGVDSLLLEEWPEAHGDFRDDGLEVEFDILAKMISLTNSARMKGKVKRRWPLSKSYYLASEEVKDIAEKNKELLLEQTNISELSLESDPIRTPIVVSAKPNFQFVAPRAKERMNELASKLSKADAAKLFNDFEGSGKTKLADMQDFELTPSDVVFTFSASEPKYSVAENYGIVVALDTSRDEELILKGLVRDVARNLQALRKEKGYNPTEILQVASIAGLGNETSEQLESKKDELSFLVRVKSVRFYPEIPQEAREWKSIEFDSGDVRIDIN